MDEIRRIEKGVYPKEKFPNRKLFLKNREDLTPSQRLILDSFFKHHQSVYISYWTKEKLREVYKEKRGKEAKRKLEDLIYLMENSDDFNLIQWARTLRKHKEYILNFFVK